MYNKLVDFNIISLFKSIKSLAFTKRAISILKNIKRVEFEKIVNSIVRKLQKAINNFVLLEIYKKQIIARIASVEYYSSRNFRLIFFDDKNTKKIDKLFNRQKLYYLYDKFQEKSFCFKSKTLQRFDNKQK